MPDWLSVVLLGIIEGLTEFLPVSSTGHLLLAQQWLPKQSELFNFVIQSGAVLAVVAVFYRKILTWVTDWRTTETRQYLGKLAFAFFVSSVGGLTAKKLGYDVLPDTAKPVVLATFIGGVIILILETRLRGREGRPDITWLIAGAIGMAQVLALIFPGTSRSGATIMVGLALGLARPAAAEFAFLLGVPSIMAAGAYEFLKYYKDPSATGENWNLVWLGTAVSAVVAFGVVKWLMHYVQNHTFLVFGWYRIVLAVVIWVWLGI